jgi:hypothetical protein
LESEEDSKTGGGDDPVAALEEAPDGTRRSDAGRGGEYKGRDVLDLQGDASYVPEDLCGQDLLL